MQEWYSRVFKFYLCIASTLDSVAYDVRDARVYSNLHIEGLGFDGDSLLMLMLFCSSAIVWKWAVLLMFQRNMLPPSSGSKSVG
jgi:hypothetical protein